MHNDKKIIFFGTPKIAAECLKTLIELKFNVCLVITKIDKPSGRNKEIIFSEVKKIALNNHIEVCQPKKLDEIVNKIKKIKPDIIITAAYGKIIPPQILSIPKYRCVNIHTSLLPSYRGGAPIQRAIMNNENYTGITLMYMDEGLDTGHIIFKSDKIIIEKTDTYTSLYDKLTNQAKKMLKEKINFLFDENLKTIKQDNLLASYAPIINNFDEQIQWDDLSINIYNKIRALYDKPIANTTYKGIKIKIFNAELTNQKATKPGEIINIDKFGLLVSCKDWCLLIKQIQLPSKKPVLISNLINGKHLFEKGTFLI